MINKEENLTINKEHIIPEIKPNPIPLIINVEILILSLNIQLNGIDNMPPTIPQIVDINRVIKDVNPFLKDF